ncbi:hypothetical protein DCS_02044 [Drechmeria coniospora]|uniref:Uncharacterized protein n=1 Tax=Drechmeria coniospora TaxID=98403 RepID=A0A151GUX6_DRECN|nr:hypothetical protein DCS_02044 [Drechmeria coniospora]KYK60905.1 hypothetical protein DCS_02044 [Drechmeria coniospora]
MRVLACAARTVPSACGRGTVPGRSDQQLRGEHKYRYLHGDAHREDADGARSLEVAACAVLVLARPRHEYGCEPEPPSRRAFPRARSLDITLARLAFPRARNLDIESLDVRSATMRACRRRVGAPALAGQAPAPTAREKPPRPAWRTVVRPATGPDLLAAAPRRTDSVAPSGGHEPPSARVCGGAASGAGADSRASRGTRPAALRALHHSAPCSTPYRRAWCVSRHRDREAIGTTPAGRETCPRWSNHCLGARAEGMRGRREDGKKVDAHGTSVTRQSCSAETQLLAVQPSRLSPWRRATQRGGRASIPSHPEPRRIRCPTCTRCGCVQSCMSHAVDDPGDAM